MPVKKVGKKWELDGDEYDTEAAAENAYKAKIALAFGVDPPKEDKKKSKKKSAKKSKKDEADEEEIEDEDEHSHED